MPTPTFWHIPYQRNPFFTGREDVLTRLHRALRAENTMALSHPQGISGLGGIGKTQTALEYAHRYRTDYDAVFWVRADSVPSLTSSLVELASVLQLPERDEQDQEIIVQAVLRWFHLHPDWLLIYDNIDDLSIAEPFLPKAGPGHLLFTTRAHALGGLAQRLDIQKMEAEIGALLLLRRANLLPLQAALNMANSDDQSNARAISEKLDGLPLALDQAGAYIKEAPCPLPDYLSRYQTRRSDILPVRGQFDQDYPASVATTWSLSFERVSQVNPAAAELLDICAFLAPDAIPEEMITEGAQHLTPSLQAAVIHPLQFDQAIASLLAYSLVGRNADATLTIHRLIQAVLKDAMDEHMQGEWALRTVLAVNEAFPEVEFTTWQQCERYLSHALACATWVEQEQINQEEAARLLYRTGWYLDDRGQYSESERLYKRALAIGEQTWGSDHPRTANIFNNLAQLYHNLGKYLEAEQLTKRALTIQEQKLGGDHPVTLGTLSNLAELYRVQGKDSEAEQLMKRVLAIREQKFGDDQPDTANSLNNLAELYRAQGKYTEAEPLYQRAISICEQRFGDDHPNTAVCLSNLAELY
jgi:tetratricopeptide (TPR) repeat protein